MKKFLAVLTSFVLVLSLVGCKTENTNEIQNDVFKIGGIGPVTGDAAVYGLAVKNGAQIAVDEINNSGGINGYKIEYRFEDDEHDIEKSVNAYNTLKDWGMQLLDGTTTSAPCIAVAEESSRDNLFQLTPSGSAVDCTKNSNVFRVCFSDPNQGIGSVDYIDTHALAKNVGVIYDASDVYSTGIYEKFIENSKNKSFNVVAEETFTSDSKTDFTTQLNKMKEANADLVFLPFYYSEAALVLAQARAMDYNPIFFSCDGMDGILTLDNFDVSLAEGVMLLTPFAADATDPITTNFVNTYRSKHGETPNQFAADSYDAIYIMKNALEKSNANPMMSTSEICDLMKKAMTEINVDGLTGSNMSWNSKGEPNKDPKAVIIRNGKYESAN